MNSQSLNGFRWKKTIHLTSFQVETLKPQSNFEFPSSLPSWLTNMFEFASLAFSLLARGGMNYDVTHSLLYFWAAEAIKINHHAAPRGDTPRSCLSCFWGPDQDAEDLDTAWYCTRREARTVYRGRAEQNCVSDDGIIYLKEMGLYRVIIHRCHIPFSV